VVEEKEIVIDEQGTKLQAMTFNGSIPGPLMVVHEGDYVEVTLVNPATNSMPHNIDFHAATGAAGGGDLTLISPGEQVVLRWKATRKGVLVYHCIPGGGMVPWNIASGMSGAVMVLPRGRIIDAADKPSITTGCNASASKISRSARREGQFQDLQLSRDTLPTPWR
jgi:nitrite reductase (NO-forming)